MTALFAVWSATRLAHCNGGFRDPLDPSEVITQLFSRSCWDCRERLAVDRSFYNSFSNSIRSTGEDDLLESSELRARENTRMPDMWNSGKIPLPVAPTTSSNLEEFFFIDLHLSTRI